MTELKELCKAKGLKSGGKKIDLIKRLLDPDNVEHKKEAKKKKKAGKKKTDEKDGTSGDKKKKKKPKKKSKTGKVDDK